ncbi:GTP-binding protein [bacterium]|nr:GTP-binding protein [bacterium]
MSEQANKRIPVTVLTGFLGSGKTTLLNYILTANHGKRFAVIENEFGEVGIDGGLVINADEEVFETNNGCICCTVRGDLIRILGNLLKRRNKFDRILIETTGVADPGPVAQTFFRDSDLEESFELDGIVTLVDAKYFTTALKKEEEAWRQVAFADVVLLNKVDLADEAQLKAVEKQIRDINPITRIHRTVRGQVDLDQILDIGGFNLDRALEMDPKFLTGETPHHHHIGSVALTTDKPLDAKKLNVWLGLLLQTAGKDIYRMKGIVNLKGMKQRFVFQGVHMLFDGKPDRPWGEDEKRHTEMVFIGRGLNRKELQLGFEACIDG